ncbi:hypothetical protein, partial [Thalassorhabdomicrobium marinisediminis]|uniref:hypothetical protein n=1 Tax=Thalassorhabdomicrobium marinisediminis TaxID=2170577 RepID=UPI001A7E1A35
ALAAMRSGYKLNRHARAAEKRHAVLPFFKGVQPTNKPSATALRAQHSTGRLYSAQVGCGPEQFFKMSLSP